MHRRPVRSACIDSRIETCLCGLAKGPPCGSGAKHPQTLGKLWSPVRKLGFYLFHGPSRSLRSELPEHWASLGARLFSSHLLDPLSLAQPELPAPLRAGTQSLHFLPCTDCTGAGALPRLLGFAADSSPAMWGWNKERIIESSVARWEPAASSPARAQSKQRCGGSTPCVQLLETLSEATAAIAGPRVGLGNAPVALSCLLPHLVPLSLSQGAVPCMHRSGWKQRGHTRLASASQGCKAPGV